jgi:hypothetical protein
VSERWAHCHGWASERVDDLWWCGPVSHRPYQHIVSASVALDVFEHLIEEHDFRQLDLESPDLGR